MDLTDRMSAFEADRLPYETRPSTGAALTRLDLIDVEPITWVWPGWIPAGMLTLLCDQVGDGKSTVASAIIAALTSGQPLPDGATVPQVNVLILSTEDDPARVIRPRLEANGADLTRVFILEIPGVAAGSTRGMRRTWPENQPEAELLRTIIDYEKIGLIVIDPLGGIIRRADRAGEGDIREALHPLMEVIAETGVAVLGVMRVGRTSTRRFPARRHIETSVLPSIARSVLMLARDRTVDAAPGARVLEVVKSNYADPPQPRALSMDASSVVRWRGPAPASIDDLAGMEDDPRLSYSEREQASIFLRNILAKGPFPAARILERSRKAGFSEITIRRCKKELGIVSRHDPGFGGSWRWILPGDEDHLRKCHPLRDFDEEGISLPERGRRMQAYVESLTDDELPASIDKILDSARSSMHDDDL